VFHVIVLKRLWDWDKNSKVFLRFGNENLGNWEENLGDFKLRFVQNAHMPQ